MTAYTFTLTCPTCAGSMRHVNGTAHGALSVAIAQCDACEREWEVCVRLRPLPDPRRERPAATARARRALRGVG